MSDRKDRKPRGGRLARRFRQVAVMVSAPGLAMLATAAAPGQESAEPKSELRLEDWKWLRPLPVPAKSQSPWIDLVISPAVFGEAKFELEDLRLYTVGGEEVPYALRVRREKSSTEEVPAEVFNRSVGPDDSREISLDMAAAEIEHNEVEVQIGGDNFRRRATLEGSPEGETWRMLSEENLIRFVRGSERIEDLRLSYPASRFRYLRLRIYPDPEVDEKPVEIESVKVRRRIAVPGEDLVVKTEFGERQPTRQSSVPASAWTIPLGGEDVPVDRIEVDAKEEDFVRDYVIQYAGPRDPRVRFHTVTSGTWRRRRGEETKPLTAEFHEIRAARLRLIVVDHSNPPLTVQDIRFAAPARQVVLPRQPPQESPLRLYYGNPEATAPRYDFARNLPERLAPAPRRTSLGRQQPNPGYIPEPVPVTERWPWIIYVILSAVSVVLAGIVLSVARTTIALHDSHVDEANENLGGHSHR